MSPAGQRDDALVPVVPALCCGCRAPLAGIAGLALLAPVRCQACGINQIVPARIGNFVLDRILGTGGMGITCRAYDEILQRHVAIKLLSGELAADREHAAAMLREARRAALVTHPHIVPVYSIGSAGGVPYIVMELLSDDLLAEPVSRNAALSERFVLETGLAMTRALAAAAEQGILHLDVKPANILHDRQGAARLIDFGLASRPEEEFSSGFGTCLYMAPERIRREGQDFRCDQYSLGLTLWQALAGQSPYDEADVDALASLILKVRPPALHLTRPGLHPWTCGLIHKMIAREPSDRYQSYRELAGAFETVLNALKHPEAASNDQNKA